MALCSITGQTFTISSLEEKLRKSFDVPDPDMLPHLRIRHLGAFWPHWSLHNRKCDNTGKDIISVFRENCPYSVWHKDEWFKNASPPKAEFDFDQSFFPQAERLFKTSPIPHNTGTNNENSEYTDDFWHGKNCYLCHNAFKCENSRYVGARAIEIKDSMYCVSSSHLEKCMDCVNCEMCFGVVYGLWLKNCRDVAFCYDCRNCTDCMFSFNLRNKQYYFGNKQLTKEQFETQKQQFEYATLMGYVRCQQLFQKMMKEIAWHRSLYADLCTESTGDYIDHLHACERTFFYSEGEENCNVTRGLWCKTMLDVICAAIECEKLCNCSAVQFKCYDVRFSFQLTESRFVDYSAHSAQLENCFWCCGLVNGKNCILNTPYSVQEYSSLREKIISHMKSTEEWWHFFPGSFAPNPYDESWSSFYFPLSPEEQKELGYFSLPNPEIRDAVHLGIDLLPKTAQETDESITKNVYWDEIAQKPFQILPQDINFCRELSVALPHTHYMRRIQENFSWMPYDWTLRTTTCAKSGKSIQTSWPSEYDGRILSEDEYAQVVV